MGLSPLVPCLDDPSAVQLAGELQPCVLLIAARTVAGQAMAIFGDHSDIMAVRSTGMALLSAHSVQESMDMSLVAHIATLLSSVPFIRSFDGMCTSHEIQKCDVIPEAQVKLEGGASAGQNGQILLQKTQLQSPNAVQNSSVRRCLLPKLRGCEPLRECGPRTCSDGHGVAQSADRSQQRDHRCHGLWRSSRVGAD